MLCRKCESLVLKVVLDTNIFVSGLLSRTGTPAKMLDAWRAGEYLLVTSPSIVAEVKAVLLSRRILEKYGIRPQDIEALVTLLEKDGLTVLCETEVSGIIPEDPKDEMFLACALEAGADMIVSGDHHLLNIGVYKGIPVLTVNQFADRLAQESKMPAI